MTLSVTLDDDGVALLEMRRPPANHIDEELLRQIVETAFRLDDDPACRVIVEPERRLDDLAQQLLVDVVGRGPPHLEQGHAVVVEGHRQGHIGDPATGRADAERDSSSSASRTPGIGRAK